MFSRYFARRVKAIIFIVFFSVTLSACQRVFPTASPSGLQITTEGVVASVFLNGEFVNKTPYVDKSLKAGSYSVRVEPEDASLAPYETSITLYPGTLAVLNWKFDSTVETSSGVLYEMEPLADKKRSMLSIMSIPDSTIVKVDDISQGFTPLIQDNVTVGSHKITVSLPSYTEQQRTVNIVEGYKMKVLVKLAKEGLATDLSSPVVATVSATPSASLSPSLSQNQPSPLATTSARTMSTPYVKISNTPTGWLRVRDQANSSGVEVAKLDSGETVPYFSTENGWHEVEYATGKKGWVSGQYAEVVR